MNALFGAQRERVAKTSRQADSRDAVRGLLSSDFEPVVDWFDDDDLDFGGALDFPIGFFPCLFSLVKESTSRLYSRHIDTTFSR